MVLSELAGIAWRELEGIVVLEGIELSEMEGIMVSSELAGIAWLAGKETVTSLELAGITELAGTMAGTIVEFPPFSTSRKSNNNGRRETPTSIGNVATSAGVSSLFPAGITHRSFSRRGTIAANSSSFSRDRTAVSNDSIPAVSFPARNASRKTVDETPSGSRTCRVILRK